MPQYLVTQSTNFNTYQLTVDPARPDTGTVIELTHTADDSQPSYFEFATDPELNSPANFTAPVRLISVDAGTDWGITLVDAQLSVLGGDAVAFHADQYLGLSIQGDVEFTAAGNVVGIEADSASFSSLYLSKFKIRGDGPVAYGIHLTGGGGYIINGGLLQVGAGSQPGSQAFGIWTTGGKIFNSGTINAVDGDPTQDISVGVGFTSSAPDQALDIENSGLIWASHAIWEFAGPGAIATDTSGQIVNNTGYIEGNVSLGLGADMLHNDGAIIGSVDLGSENDVFDGKGSLTGDVHGGTGDDLITAGAGAFSAFGDAGNDTFFMGTGAAKFTGGDGIDLLDLSSFSTAANVDLSLTTAQAQGSASVQVASIEDVHGTALGDHLSGDGSSNHLLGQDGDDNLDGRAGDDILSGGTGNDTEHGGDGNDAIYGDDGDDVIDGGAGNDAIDGGVGTDTLTGGAGADTFVFFVGSGHDVVTDFDVSQDVIDLSQTDGVSSYSAAQVDGDVVVTLTPDDTITLKNVSLSLLTAAQFKLAGTTPLNLVGGDGADFLSGDAGDDMLSGGAGNDTLYGGGGNDILSAGTGRDTLHGGVGDDILKPSLDYSSIVIDGGNGEDTVDYSDSPLAAFVFLSLGYGQQNLPSGYARTDHYTSIENATGTNAWGDTLYGDDEANTLKGLGGDDRILGFGGDDHLLGGDGNDYLQGDAGADTMVGGVGDDTYSIDSLGDVIIENADEGTDTVNTSLLHYTLAENIENLVINGIGLIGTGNALDNMMTSGFGSSGTLAGGAGDDTYVVGGTFIKVVENPGEGTDTVQAGMDYVLGANLENLTLSDNGNYGPVLKGTGNTEDNVITGNILDNVLSGLAGNDTLIGGAGNDLLDGGTGGDNLYGGTGDDTYIVDDSHDHVFEAYGAGKDTIEASVSYVIGGQYVESLILTGTANINATGNGQINNLTGNSGNNVLNGGQGADVMHGGAGNDTYYVDNPGDVASEQTVAGVDDGGNDAVVAAVSYTLGAFIERMSLSGYNAINGTGNASDNTISGNGAANKLSGMDGNDWLRGGGGNDTLTGGAGADTFVFEHPGGANGLDHITDFVSGEDKLNFHAGDFGLTTGAVLTGDQFSDHGRVGTDGQFIYNTATHTLYWDADGTGPQGAVSIAIFDNAVALHASDFIFT